MSKTIWEQAIKKLVDNHCEREDGLKDWLEMGADRMNSHYYDDLYLETISQKFISKYDIYDAYCFVNINLACFDGKILYLVIPIGHTPSSDSAIESNNAKLKSLPEAFGAEFWGGKKMCDGVLRWNRPVKFGDMQTEQQINKGDVVLEVGYTSAFTTMSHIREHGGVARWPYGHDEIGVLIPVHQSQTICSVRTRIQNATQ